MSANPRITDTPLSITNINGTFYYHRDHQGSIIALSNEEGEIVEQITYDGHYGKVLKHSIQEKDLTLNPYGYTGREMDADDLYYYRARYYDPNTQRFLSLDPIGFEAGDFNFYRYVGNDPVNYVDPSGLIGKGGLSDLSDAVGDLKDSTDKIKNILKDSEKSRKCPEGEEAFCEVQNLADKLKAMEDRARKGAEEEIKSFGGPGAEFFINAVNNSKPSSPPIVADTNTTTPTVTQDGNLTQAIGKASTCQSWWNNLEGKDSILGKMFCD